MIINYNSFVHVLFIGIIALFPVVNPIGSAFIVSPFFANLDGKGRRAAVRKITFYSFIICAVCLYVGHYILELFGLSIPVVQLAGGIMICRIGWISLVSENSSNEDKRASAKRVKAHDKIDDKLFYPITFPVTVGPGTISVLFTLSANNMGSDFRSSLTASGAIMLAILFTCILVYIFYLNTDRIIHFLGATGETIVNRLSAFLIFCVGLQIAVSGISALVKLMR
jgi:multiple antibiotic resistance protein